MGRQPTVKARSHRDNKPNGWFRRPFGAPQNDLPPATDSAHWLSVEDQNAVAAFKPTSTTKHATATRVVTVTDGRLTLSPRSGSNTELNHVDVDGLPDGSPSWSSTGAPRSAGSSTGS